VGLRKARRQTEIGTSTLGNHVLVGIPKEGVNRRLRVHYQLKSKLGYKSPMSPTVAASESRVDDSPTAPTEQRDMGGTEYTSKEY